MKTPLFRQTKLDDLTSPEQLDTIMRVTSPKGWLALLTLMTLLALALVWSVTSTVPVGVAGRGMLLSGDGINPIVADEAGQLQELFVSEGDVVSAGDVIGRLQPFDSTQPPVTLVSPFAGQVVEATVFPGDLIQRGQGILSLISTDDLLWVVVYVPVTEGRRVQPGMDVHISPTTVSSAEYGVMKGTVQSVGDFPASSARIIRLLGNDLAVQQFIAGGPQLEVRVALTPSPHTVSGYAWSSPQGPPLKLRTGTLAQATVIVERTRPIELILATGGL